MLEKQQSIVALDHPKRPKKARPPRNNLMLSLKKNDLELNFYSSLDPFSGRVFIFCGGSRDRFKALYWDGQGYWLLYKRFENGKMIWPNNQDEVKALSKEQVDWLMKGFSIEPGIKATNARNFY